MNPDAYSISPFILQPNSHIALSPEEYGVKLCPNWREKVLKGLLKGESLLDIHYFDVNGVPNPEWWSRFKNQSNYREWYDFRVYDNMEVAYLMAELLEIRPEHFATMVVDILAKKDMDALNVLLKKSWERSLNKK